MGVRAASLHIHQQPLGFLDALLDADEERHGLAAVDDAVVVGKREVHHRTCLDLVADHHRAHLDLVHAQDRRLRRVEDRRRHQRAVNAAIRDRERAAREILDGELAVARLAAELADPLPDICEPHLIRVADHRHDEALAGADGDADVVMVLVDDVVALDLRVDRRQFLERHDAGLDEERHEAQAHAVLLLEAVAIALTERHHSRHVRLVEGGEHGSRVLGFLQALGDPLAEPRHVHALLPRAELAGRPCRLRPRRLRGGRGLRRPALDRSHHVGLSGASVLASGFDLPRRESALGASLRAAGPERSSALGAAGCGTAPGAGFAAGAAAAVGAISFTAPSIVPSTPPTLTFAPSGTRISESTPAAVAFTSSVTLSVSSSMTGSSTATVSPIFLSHFATVASVTDSPSAGTLISVAIGCLELRGRARRLPVSAAPIRTGHGGPWRSPRTRRGRRSAAALP